MTTSLDTVSMVNGGGGTKNSISWSHTVAGSANGLVVGLTTEYGSTGNGGAASGTYNGVALSSLTTGVVFASLSGQTLTSELWYIANPATGANTVSFTFSNPVRCIGFGASFIGVSSTSATGAPSLDKGNGTTTSLNTIACTGTSDFVVAVTASNPSATMSVTANGQTLSAWTQAGSSPASLGGIDTAQATGTTSGMSIILSSSRSWVMTGVAVLAAAGGGGGGGSSGTGSYYYLRRRRF